MPFELQKTDAQANVSCCDKTSPQSHCPRSSQWVLYALMWRPQAFIPSSQTPTPPITHIASFPQQHVGIRSESSCAQLTLPTPFSTTLGLISLVQAFQLIHP